MATSKHMAPPDTDRSVLAFPTDNDLVPVVAYYAAELPHDAKWSWSGSLHIAPAWWCEMPTKETEAARADALRDVEGLVRAMTKVLQAEFGPAMTIPDGCKTTYWAEAATALAKAKGLDHAKQQ